MAEVQQAPIPSVPSRTRIDSTVSVGEGVVVDLELGVGEVEPASGARVAHSPCCSRHCLTMLLGFLKNLFRISLLASWCVLMVVSYVSESVVLAGLSVAGLMFSVYFMLFPALLAYLKEDLEASQRKQMANPKVRDVELDKFEHMCPSSTVEDATIPEDACAVCLVSMDIGEHVRHLSCGHVLHSACLDEWWFAQKGDKMTCPLCRHSEVVEPAGEPQADEPHADEPQADQPQADEPQADQAEIEDAASAQDTFRL